MGRMVLYSIRQSSTSSRASTPALAPLAAPRSVSPAISLVASTLRSWSRRARLRVEIVFGVGAVGPVRVAVLFGVGVGSVVSCGGQADSAAAYPFATAWWHGTVRPQQGGLNQVNRPGIGLVEALRCPGAIQ
jgi:hypothetical protein